MGTGFTLITACPVRAAIGARADDVSIRKKAAIRYTEHLLQRPLFNEAVLLEPRKEVLGQGVIARRGRPSEMIEGQIEPPIYIGLYKVLALAVGAYVTTCFRRSELRRGAMFVGCA